MITIFTDKFLKEIGYTLISRKKSIYHPYQIYGKAKDRNGMTILLWNEQGHSCTYSGDKLKPNNSFGIQKDGGTRDAFSGYVFNEDDVRNLLRLTN